MKNAFIIERAHGDCVITLCPAPGIGITSEFFRPFATTSVHLAGVTASKVPP